MKRKYEQLKTKEMEKRALQFRMIIKAMMIALVLGITGMMKGYAQIGSFEVNYGEYWLEYYFNYGTTTVNLYHYYNGNGIGPSSLIIPSTVTYQNAEYTVIEIGKDGEPVFQQSDPSSITSIIIPESVTTIGSYAFQGCNNLINITIPESVTKIGLGAFYECNSLINITIPETVTSIGSEAFYGTGWYNSQADGVLYLGDCCIGYKGEQPTDVLSIQEGTRLLAEYAFHECYSLSSVVIPNSVIRIGRSAFFCTSISEITLGNSLVSIEDDVFNSCNFLTSVVIPNSVTSIGNGAFSNCMNLTSISIPDGVTSIGRDAFMFTNLNSLILPSSLQTIGGCAFSGCFNLTGSLVIPNAVTVVDEEAFYLCSGLTSLILGNSLETIGYRAFESCSGLSGILTIPQSVTQIGDRAFLGCINLSEIIVESENPIYDSRDNCNAIIKTSNNTLIVGCNNSAIPHSVTTIGESAFCNCTFANISIPNSVTTIQQSAFINCHNLTSVTIPNSVTFLGNGAFAGCNSLTSFTFPNSIVRIGSYLFGYDNNIASLNVLATNPPTLMNTYGNNSFFGVDKSIPVYVPYGAENVYMFAYGWSEFTNYKELSYAIVSGYGDGEGKYRFIASPLVENTPTVVENMITETEYDLYQFNPLGENGEWQNYKADSFNLVNGRGYLYANAKEVNVIFKGEFNEDETKTISLTYNAASAGWNLVGNPFPVSAYINRAYYVMNEEGTGINPVAVSASTPIPPCTGVFVKTEGEGETVIFTRAEP